ncbi:MULTISPECIES: M13 family metallopeptidase [unclassified Sphingomonas]|jgi:putative endopeptidase|uniref:M13 family metallopeptidase n=1 Tax=unclassified Sphingomonas TaxID=196159 RepID=UPI000E104601|nr:MULTISPECIES: M13 family metallopeptidase [unclassified Sphingomonas]AXJ95823.1 M13 family peptidase [Sphingomonas sp. FARSPH]
MKRFVLAAAAGLLAGTAALAQTRPAGVDATAIDRGVKPGDDFDAYANGAWRARAVIPADRSSTGVFLRVIELADQRNASIVADARAANGAAGSDQRRIADYYAAYMDQAGIEARGIAPLKPAFAAIDAVRDKAQLSRLLGQNVRVDVDPLNATNFQTGNILGLFVTQAFDRPTETVPYVLQGGLGMPDRDYYLSDTPAMREVRDAYRTYVTTVFQLAGFSDPATRAVRVIDLETKIARAHVDLVTSQDAHKADNPWKKADFAAKAPGIDWDGFWQAAGLGRQQVFVAWQPGAITGLSALVASEPLAAWQDWVRFHRIDRVASVLPRGFDQASFAFYGKALSGTPEQRARDKRALNAVNGALGGAMGRIYAQRYFPASSKADIQAMVGNILKAFDTRVAGLTWMQPATKAEARRKIETMVVGIGYPDAWADDRGLEVRADDPVGNIDRAELARTRQQLAKIGRPVDRREWWIEPQVVNALNLPLQNALNFPAAILEAPFYDPKRDAAANYGSIGAIIGHEVSHSFDNLGADFDADGRLRNWWTPQDLARFEAQGQALVAQYDAYQPLPGLHVNGRQTLGENIADVAGLTAALDAYHASLGGKPAPVIDGMTGDQRLFLAFAQSWAEKARDKAVRAQVQGDVHAPGRFRAETVRNIDDWYAAFGVKPGDALYLAPDKRVHVW